MKRNRYFLIILAASGAAAVSAASVANIDTYAPVPNGLEREASRLEEFCEQHWGTLSPDLATCRFEQTHYFGVTALGKGAIAESGIPVLAGDFISFEASEGAVPLVGSREVSATEEFAAVTEGYLSFRAPYGGKLVSLRKVRQVRCFRLDGNSLRPTPCND